MVRNNLTLYGARIFRRDFAGKNYGRGFAVVIEPELAEKLRNDGWTLKHLDPRNEEEQPIDILNVKIKFDPYPPQIVAVKNERKYTITERNVADLDAAFITNADMVIRPYNYDIRGEAGVSAYLKSLWVTLGEDPLEAKYRDLPYAVDSSNPDGDSEPLPFN